MMCGAILAAAIAASPVTLPDTVWKTPMFVDTIHKMYYGDVVATNCESELTVNSRNYRILDFDGKYREFVIDAFKTDLAKEYPTITTSNCGRNHTDCPYVKMYLARHAIYAKQDRMRLKWIENAEKAERRSQIQPRLFYRRPRPIRWVPPKREEDSTGK